MASSAESPTPAPRAAPEPRSGRASALATLLERSLSAIGDPLDIGAAELVLVDGPAAFHVIRHERGASGTTERQIPRDGVYADLSMTATPVPAVHGTDALQDADAIESLQTQDGAVNQVVVTGLGPAADPCGILLLCSARREPFAPQELRLITPVAEFLAIAADRERLWAMEQIRHQRRVRLEAMLPRIAESLDVRQVFGEVSGLIQEVIPHDVLAFALLLPDRSGVRVQAATTQGVMELPEYRFSTDEERLDANWNFLLAYDLEPVDALSVRARISPRSAPEPREVVTRPGAAWMKFITEAGIRSTMRVPIRSREEPIGGVAFMSRWPDAFDAEDGIVASRIADQLSLALAHQELAEEQRQIALAEERARLLAERVDQLSRELQRFSAHRALGASSAWKKALTDAAEVATTDTTVLVTGESGTGKEVIARYIHRGSKRASGPFVALNCAALPEQLLESELFGHERGAFTGATEARAGKIEQATGGVLFLDEVGEMLPAVQAKFLRVLQEREYQRVGGSRILRAEVRIVAATNRDPRAAIARGEFREDLYYRLGVFEIHLPPLRERPEDILLLADAFLAEVGETIGRPAAGFSEAAREQLLAHVWPGNVRELKNAIERAVILCRGGLITREHLPTTVARPVEQRIAMAASPASEFPAEGVPLGEVKRDLVVKALAKTRQNKVQAAKLLGISRGQLYSLMRRYGLTDARR